MAPSTAANAERAHVDRGTVIGGLAPVEHPLTAGEDRVGEGAA